MYTFSAVYLIALLCVSTFFVVILTLCGLTLCSTVLIKKCECSKLISIREPRGQMSQTSEPFYDEVSTIAPPLQQNVTFEMYPNECYGRKTCS